MKTLNVDELKAIDINEEWKYSFINERDFNLFVNLLTDFFNCKPYSLPKQTINLKKGCKTRFAKALNPIYKELSSDNKKMKTDKKFFQLIRVLSHFKDESDHKIYQAITR